MLVDYHMHLELDDHYGPLRVTPERIANYVKQARDRGVDEIAITEHCYRFREFEPIMRHLYEDPDNDPHMAGVMRSSFQDSLADYVEVLADAGRRGLPVKVGLEVDYFPGKEAEIQAVLESFPWDVVLGSVHYLGLWPIDCDPQVGWPERDVDTVYHEYFSTLQQAAASGLFDVLAHPDLVKKFGFRPSGDISDLIEETVAAIAAADAAVELSTAGLHKPVTEAYPTPDILQRCRAHAIPLTLASDAHRPQDVGRDIRWAGRLARSCGYDWITVFQGRSRTERWLG